MTDASSSEASVDLVRSNVARQSRTSSRSCKKIGNLNPLESVTGLSLYPPAAHRLTGQLLTSHVGGVPAQ